MIRSISFITAMFISLSLFSGEKGEAWKSWLEFEKAVKAQDYDLAKSFTSGTWISDSKFNKQHLTLLAWELHKNPVKFVNEFKEGDNDILVLKSWLSPVSLTFLNVNGKLTINKWVLAELKPGGGNKEVDSKIATVKIKLAEIRAKLRNIAKAYQKYFEGNREKLFPKVEDLNTDPDDWSYADPETGANCKILPVAPGHKKTNSANYPMAITASSILGQHYAVFDDGSLRPFHKGCFPVIIENFSYSLMADKFQEDLIMKLASPDREIRKKAREDIEESAHSIAPVLRNFADHEDPEISMTVKAVLKELEVKNQFRHAVYELEKVPKSIALGLGKYFIVETEKNFLAVKLLKHTRPFQRYKTVENYGTEYEVTAFSKEGKKLESKKGEVYYDYKRRSNSMKYIHINQNFIHWEMGDNIYFDAHVIGIARTAHTDLSKVDVTSKEYAWLKIKKKKISENGPSIDIFVNPDYYSYQGNKRSLDEMERTLMGLGAAMGPDILVVIRVDPKANRKMVDFLIARMLKYQLINFKEVEQNTDSEKTVPPAKDGPVLTPVRTENVKEK